MDIRKPSTTMTAPEPSAELLADAIRAAADHIPGLVWTSLPDGYIDFLNLRWREFTGLTLEQSCGWGWQVAIHPEDLPGLLQTWTAVLASGAAGEAEARLRRSEGDYHWCAFRAVPLHDADGRLVKWYGQTLDIDAVKRAEALLAGEKQLLEMVAKGHPLDRILDAICRLVEALAPETRVSVMLLDEATRRLWTRAAPSLPREYLAAVDGCHIDARPGPCAHAASAAEVVLVPDIAAEPRWYAYADVAIRCDVRALLSMPILSSTGEVLGAIAMYFREPVLPTSYQRNIIDQLTHLAAVAVERARTDSALQASEERFRRMADSTPDVIWITELDPERVLYASPSFERIWGRKVDALYRDPHLWIDGIHPEDRSRVAHDFGSWIRDPLRHGWDAEFRVIRPDGATRWVHERGVGFVDDVGGRRVSGVSTDITERRLAEVALRESEQRFALAVSGSNDGIWDWDIVTNQMFLSERAQLLYGLEPGLTVRPRMQWQAMVVIHPDCVAHERRLLDDYLAGGPSCDAELRVRHADGSHRWIRIRGVCIRDASGRPTRMAGSVSDIDPQKRAEAALLQAQRLEATGTLAGGIAHDFNNILAAILGYGEMALRDVPEGTRLRRDLDSILTAAERGRSLVDRILAFSRSGASERSLVHVEGVVREALDLLSATLPDRVRLDARLSAGRAAMLGDATQIHQVVMNLATNAVQAMSMGGDLTVWLQVVEVRSELLTSTGPVAPGEYLQLQMADQGCGIAPSILARIFDPFFTTKDTTVGTGLGLSLVHGIVTEVGGAVDVASKLGEGSVFTVYLPRAGDAVDFDDADAPEMPRGQRQRVLVVDDEATLVTLMTDALSDLGYEPCGHTSSAAALAAFQAHPEDFDVLVTDERMPDLSGSALVREVRRLRNDIPIVLVSGFLGGAINEHARTAGANEVLQKPLAARDLAAALSRLVPGPR